MKYNIWHDGERDAEGNALWWVEAEEEDSMLRVTLDVFLPEAETYVAGVVADDDIVCTRDFTTGKDLCGKGLEFKAGVETTRRFLEAARCSNQNV